MRRGKVSILLLSALTAFTAGSTAGAAAGANEERGRLLYENHCTSCHSSVAHLRAKRKAQSVDDIRKQVARWSGYLGLEWKADEMTDVVDYLNETFYGFGAGER